MKKLTKQNSHSNFNWEMPLRNMNLFSKTKMQNKPRLSQELSNKIVSIDSIIRYEKKHSSFFKEPIQDITYGPIDLSHLPQTQSILRPMPLNSKEIANSLMNRFNANAARAVVAMRRIDYTAKLNEKKRMLRNIIFIQKFWRYSFYFKIQKRVIRIQKGYRGYLIRKRCNRIRSFGPLFIQLKERYDIIQLRYYYSIVICNLIKSKESFRASIGIQVDNIPMPVTIVQDPYINLLLLNENDKNEQTVSKGLVTFPRPLNILSKKKSENNRIVNNLRLKISKESQMYIKKQKAWFQSKHNDHKSTENKKLDLKLIPVKVCTGSNSMFTKCNISIPNMNKALTLITLLQKFYRKHKQITEIKQEQMKSLTNDTNTDLHSFTFNQIIVFKLKLFIVYMSNYLNKRKLWPMFISIKNYKSDSHHLSTTINGETITQEDESVYQRHQKQSSQFTIDNELDNKDHLKIKEMTENCNGLITSTERMRVFFDESDEQSIDQSSFSENDFDDTLTIEKKIPNKLTPFSYHRIKNLSD